MPRWSPYSPFMIVCVSLLIIIIISILNLHVRRRSSVVLCKSNHDICMCCWQMGDWRTCFIHQIIKQALRTMHLCVYRSYSMAVK